MGQKAAKQLAPDDLKYLLDNTTFTEEQIRHWYKGFRKDCRSGLLSRRKFLDVYATFFPDGNATEFYEHVFRTFDKDNSGKIDFVEFLMAISITQGGRPRDKLELAFRLYDIDQNGTIEEAEMVQIMTAIYQMVGRSTITGNDPAIRTREIFLKMDKNKDGKLTKEEFINGCLEDKTLYELMTTS